MNKSLAMIIKETKRKLADICNESALHPSILDLIIQGLYFEIHSLAERQVLEEEKAYALTMVDKKVDDENSEQKGDLNE